MPVAWSHAGAAGRRSGPGPATCAWRSTAPRSSPPVVQTGTATRSPTRGSRRSSSVAAVDLEALDLKRIFVHPAIDGFISVTAVIRIGTVAGIVPR